MDTNLFIFIMIMVLNLTTLKQLKCFICSLFCSEELGFWASYSLGWLPCSSLKRGADECSLLLLYTEARLFSSHGTPVSILLSVAEVLLSDFSHEMEHSDVKLVPGSTARAGAAGEPARRAPLLLRARATAEARPRLASAVEGLSPYVQLLHNVVNELLLGTRLRDAFSLGDVL